MTEPPILVEPIPPQSALEGANFTALNCNDYFANPDFNNASGALRFYAELPNGAPIPYGLTCSLDGVLSGSPEMGTHGEYEIQIIAENDSGTPVETRFHLTIHEKKTAQAGEPILVNSIPTFVINIGAALGPVDLKQYIHAANSAAEKLYFTAELTNGGALPKGLICTSSGILSGIPASGTIGNYQIHLTVESKETGKKLETRFDLIVKERIEIGGEPQFYTGLKAQIWEALEKNQPVPEFAELFNRQLTAVEMYYLMQRFATLTIYDVYNLDPPGTPKLLTLQDASPHYHVYDRGSCIVATPKDLFSHERTLVDSLITAKAMAAEVYKRDWTVEFVGFQKMMRAAWIELQVLGEKQGKFLNILHYNPTVGDLKICEAEIKTGTTLGKQR